MVLIPTTQPRTGPAPGKLTSAEHTAPLNSPPFWHRDCSAPQGPETSRSLQGPGVPLHAWPPVAVVKTKPVAPGPQWVRCRGHCPSTWSTGSLHPSSPTAPWLLAEGKDGAPHPEPAGWRWLYLVRVGEEEDGNGGLQQEHQQQHHKELGGGHMPQQPQLDPWSLPRAGPQTSDRHPVLPRTPSQVPTPGNHHAPLMLPTSLRTFQSLSQGPSCHAEA